jgi:hypothetical protein
LLQYKILTAIIMSYYGVHSSNINSVTCANCQTEAFAWVAEIFVCPVCGSHEYIFVAQDDSDTEDGKTRKENGEGSVGKQESMERKRKREEGSEGEGW